MTLLRLLLTYLAARGGRRGGLPNFLLQAVLARGLRRTPMGFFTMLVLDKVLRGDGRLWGMDLASRRKARMAWLASLLQRFTSGATKAPAPIWRRLSR